MFKEWIEKIGLIDYKNKNVYVINIFINKNNKQNLIEQLMNGVIKTNLIKLSYYFVLKIGLLIVSRICFFL